MKMNKGMFIGLIIFLAVIVISSSVYVVDETKQCIITQFGDPVGDPVTDAGLHVKLPFIQKVTFFEKRIMEWDGDRNEIPTKDKKYRVNRRKMYEMKDDDDDSEEATKKKRKLPLKDEKKSEVKKEKKLPLLKKNEIMKEEVYSN